MDIMIIKIIGVLLNIFIMPGLGQIILDQKEKGYKFIGLSLCIIIPCFFLYQFDYKEIASAFSFVILMIIYISIIDIYKMEVK